MRAWKKLDKIIAKPSFSLCVTLVTRAIRTVLAKKKRIDSKQLVVNKVVQISCGTTRAVVFLARPQLHRAAETRLSRSSPQACRKERQVEELLQAWREVMGGKGARGEESEAGAGHTVRLLCNDSIQSMRAFPGRVLVW